MSEPRDNYKRADGLNPTYFSETYEEIKMLDSIKFYKIISSFNLKIPKYDWQNSKEDF